MQESSLKIVKECIRNHFYDYKLFYGPNYFKNTCLISETLKLIFRLVSEIDNIALYNNFILF